ncbi:blue copper protein-like [Papaver somniferum]|uniref:blue copper protein-like n=1 Tax=Papaver somniferum TaxID=3469 RepID=UPI000E6FD488|nr:blue copper protein-like [Papaver somniferum]
MAVLKEELRETVVDKEMESEVEEVAIGSRRVFKYSAQSDSVYEVSEASYEECETDKFISSDSSGHTVIWLETPGKHYFISGNEDHCVLEMRLEITAGEPSYSDDTSSSSSALL